MPRIEMRSFATLLRVKRWPHAVTLEKTSRRDLPNDCCSTCKISKCRALQLQADQGLVYCDELGRLHQSGLMQTEGCT